MCGCTRSDQKTRDSYIYIYLIHLNTYFSSYGSSFTLCFFQTETRYEPTFQCIAKVVQMSLITLPIILTLYLDRKWTDIRELDLSKQGHEVLVRGRMHNSRIVGN